MSTKTGKCTKTTASGSGSSATVTFDPPPPLVWPDPPDRIWDVLVAAYTKGSDVTITFDDSTAPPTPTAASGV